MGANTLGDVPSDLMQALYEGRRADAEALATGRAVDVFEAASLGDHPSLAALLRIEHPATELLQPRLRGKPRQALVVKDVRDDVGAGELLGVQALAACIRFPGHAPQRVAGLERPQAGKVFRTDGA